MLKSKLPTVESLLKPQEVDSPQQTLHQWSDKQEMYYDQNAKQLSSIKEGETARIRKGKTWEPAIVTAPRSYIVQHLMVPPTDEIVITCSQQLSHLH